MTWRPGHNDTATNELVKGLKKITNQIKSFFYAIVSSFPIHLLLYNLKKNHVLLLFWVIIWAFISGAIGQNLGIPYLFLDPEYLDKINLWSFFILGITLGGFTMAFHITCYILDGYRYTFLSTMRYPLLQFSVNNSIIPVAFIIYYLVKVIVFQLTYEENSIAQIAWKIFGLLAGMVFMFLLTHFYFRLTRRTFFKELVDTLDKKLKRGRLQRVNVMERLHKVQKERVKITSYYQFPFSIRSVNNNYPYDRKSITRVFDQTQLNAVIIQILTISFSVISRL